MKFQHRLTAVLLTFFLILCALPGAAARAAEPNSEAYGHFHAELKKIMEKYGASPAETESEPETGAPEDETGSAKASQGIYEIISAVNVNYLMDVKHCTVEGSDSKTIQLFRSLDVNQQKFYIEELSDGFWRISAVYSGEALTVSEDGASFLLASMEHPEEQEAAASQSWLLQDAGDGYFYICTPKGMYLTLDSARAYSGAAVVLEEFTGRRTQKWLLGAAWISSEDTADTDLVNPYGEDGPSRYLNIILKFGDASEVLTGGDLAAHTVENESHEYVLDSGYLSSFVSELAARYDTQGQARRFMTSRGYEITLTEGTFGWKLDEAATEARIRENLLAASQVILEPVWSNEGVSFTTAPDRINDIGDSYVEVDLRNQKVWLYKDGECLLETDCVSGTMDTESQTPSGVYSIFYMQSPAVLKGADYSSPVTYWMPFYGNYGLHDATWRSEFGGDIFRTNGSHGCINLPYESAERIYDTVWVGYPVILYF